MDVSGPWSLDLTTVCVSVFVLSLGALWMYVMLGRPATSQYQRLEALLSEPDVKKGAGGVKGNSGKKKGRGKNRPTEGSPRHTQSPQRKKKTSSPEVTTIGSDATKVETERGVADEKAGKATVAREPMVAKAMEGVGEEDAGGEFQLVTKTSKGKRETPVVTPETKEGGGAGSKAGKKRKDEHVSKTTPATKSSSAVPKATTKGDAPVVPKTNSDKEDPSPVSKTVSVKNDLPASASKTTAKENTPAVTKTTPKEDTPVVTKTTTKETAPITNKSTKSKQKRSVPAKEGTNTGDDRATDTSKVVAAVNKGLEKTVAGGGEERVEEVKDEEKNKEGEWHTQLSRQQLRALKQKEKEKVESQQKSVVIEERETDGARRGAVQRSPRGRGTGREVRGEGGGGGKDGGGGRRREAAVVRSRREREGEPKKWNLPNKGDGDSAGTAGEGGVASLPEAPPTAAATSDHSQGNSPVAHSNFTDLEKAMRDAALTTSSSSDDIIITSSSKPTTAVDTIISQDPDTTTSSQPTTLKTQHSDGESPTPAVTIATEADGPFDKTATGDEAIVSQMESPDDEEWVVLEEPT